MGELIGIPEWLFATLSAVVFLVVVGAVAWRNTNRQIAQTLARCSNLTEAEFIAAMEADVSRETARFLWDSALEYLEFLKQEMTPHPDDSLMNDLPIDEDDWGLDWPRIYSEERGFHESDFPDWPEDWPVTVRNYGRWLDMAPV